MANITMKVSKHEYKKSEFGTVQGHAHSISYQYAGSTQVNRGVSGINGSQFDAIKDSLSKILRENAQMYRQSAVTIEGSTLPESLQAHLTAIFEAETPFTSITFA